MLSASRIDRYVREILEDAGGKGDGKVSFALIGVEPLPDQKAFVVNINITVHAEKKDPANEGENNRSLRWIIPGENLFSDVQNQKWALPWVLSPLRDPEEGKKVKKSWWNVKEKPDLGCAHEYPAWYALARKFFRQCARGIAKKDFQMGEVHRLEGRLNALWTGPFGEIGEMLRADRLSSKENPLKELEAQRRVELDAPSEGNGRIRRTHSSHKEVLCPFHTPESKRIGLQLYRSACNDENAEKLRKSPDDFSSLLSIAVGMIPYPQHSDGPRLLMGGKNMKQAETDIAEPEPAMVPGKLETAKSAFGYLAGKDHVKEKRLFPFLGANALVAVMPFEGYTYEDGLVISRDFANRLTIPEREVTQRAFLELSLKAGEKKKEKKKKDDPVKLRHDWEQEMQQYCGNPYRFGDYLPLPDCEEFCTEGLPSPTYEEREPGTLSGVSFRYLQHRPRGKSPETSKHNEEPRTPLDMEITWHFTISRPMGLGDKLTGRHGNKGVVTRILEEPPMVTLGNKEFPVDLCISPCSVLGRKNFGQIVEMVHSLALKTQNEGLFPEDVLVQDEILMDDMNREGGSWHSLVEALEKTQILKGGAAPVTINLSGETKTCHAFVGYQYFCRLRHHAPAKMQARGSDGPLNLMTMQPSSGIPRGGQRLGEMENWAFLSHGVHPDFDGEKALGLLNRLREMHRGEKKARDLLRDIFYALGFVRDPGIFSGVPQWIPLERGPQDADWANFAQGLNDIRTLPEKPGIVPLGTTQEKEKEVFQALGECATQAIAQGEARPTEARALLAFLAEAQPEAAKVLVPLCDALQEAVKDKEDEKNKTYPLSLKGFFLLRPGGMPVVPGLFTFEKEMRPLPRRAFVDLLKNCELLSQLPGEANAAKRYELFKTILKRLKKQCRTLEKLLEGKTGYLRRHCMGRRCDHSGRGVIVPDPDLALDEVRLPVTMFLEMMQHHSVTEERGVEGRMESLLSRASRGEDLEGIVQECNELFEGPSLWAVLIRQPSLHRHSVQSFRITLWKHPVIGLPPFITPGFNADFDGDTMAVYIPHQKDQEGASFLSLCKSPGKTGDGSLQIASDKDLALGWCALSRERRKIWLNLLGEKSCREPFEEEWIPLEDYLRRLVAYRGERAFEDLARLQRELCETSTGAATVSPAELNSLYKDMQQHREEIAGALDTLTVEDELEERLEGVKDKSKGLVKESEEAIIQWLKKHPQSSLARLVLGKARGKASDLRQTVVALGHQSRYAEDEGKEYEDEKGKKHVLPLPYNKAWIRGCFWGGLSTEDLFMYSYPSRESMASKKLAVAPAGHLTWQLAEGLFDVVLQEGDCGSQTGLLLQKVEERDALALVKFGEETLASPLLFPGTLGEALKNAAWGRVPQGMTRAFSMGDLEALIVLWEEGLSPDMEKDLAQHLQQHGGALLLRSPLTCAYASEGKICSLCYGADTARMPLDGTKSSGALELLPSGAAVGLTAAEAIGERGTQLAMKRFHQVGGDKNGGEKRDRLGELERLLVRKDKEQLPQEQRFRKMVDILTDGEKNGHPLRYEELPQQMIHFEAALICSEGLKAYALRKEMPFPLRVARDIKVLWEPLSRDQEVSKEDEGLKKRIFGLEPPSPDSPKPIDL